MNSGSLNIFKFVASKKYSMAEKPRNFIHKILKSYRLTITDKSNFVEVYNTSVSKLKLWLFIAVIFLFSLAVVLVVFFYTPAKQIIPGYPSDQLHQMMVHNALMVDSLQDELERRDNYLDKIRQVISGEVVEDRIDTAAQLSQVEMAPMNNDSIFNDLIGPDKYKFSYLSNGEDFNQISKVDFFTPIKGLVTNKFGTTPGHFGTDIVAKENSFIASVLDGTVIFAEWSVSTGYVVVIQHDYNLISVYKHNSDVLVKAGDRVKAGTVIAIMGNEGEYSTGPHLHFELWQNGTPLNPEQYISF